MKVKTSLLGEPLASEEDFSCSPGGKEEVEMDEAHFEGETMLANSPSEGSAKSCRSKRCTTNIRPCKVLLKNIDCELNKYCLIPPKTKSCRSKSCTTKIKPCKVLLKNIDCELNKYCLIPPKTKKLQQKIRNTKKMVSLKMFQAGLCDLLDRHVKTPRYPQNPATLIENKKVNEMDSALVLNSSAKILSKKINADRDSKKTERESGFPDSSTLCSSIFTKCSSIKSNPENSVAGFCHSQENKREGDNLQEVPVLIAETQNTISFEPTEKCIEHGKTLIEQTEGKGLSHRTGSLKSEYSEETSTDSTSQPSRMNTIPFSPGDTSQTSRTNSAGSSATSLCELEPYLVSSLPGSALKVDSKDEFPRKNTAKRPVGGRRDQYSVQLSAEVVVQEQVTREELDALNQSKEKDDSCWFELEGNEVVNGGGPINATHEENMSQKMQNGDGCLSFLGDVTNTKHSEIRKETALNGREIGSVEECGNSQPAQESLARELSDSAIKLLGTPRESSVVLSLDRLIELEESSDSEVQTGSHSTEDGQGSNPLLDKENEGSLYSTELTWHQPLYSDNTGAMKSRIWRPNRRPARIRSSKLSQEESRIKVVDALREVLQNRLDDSPNLRVQEDTVLRVAKKVEKALFNLSCRVDQHYKNKYRSLLFNLKSAKNQLFCQVILGVISPKRLVQMSALELAPEDLAEWRASERRHALEVIEKEEREAPRCYRTKFTHKGLIEIHRETDEDLMFQEIFGSQLLEAENSQLESPAGSMGCSKDSHKSCVSDFDCVRDTGQMAADRFKPPTRKHILKQKKNVSKCLQSNSVYSGGGETQLQEGCSAISSSFPKKHLHVGNQSTTSVIWKGHIQMFSLKPFAAKSYPVSGYGCHLFQALPDLLQSRGCILPEDVWAYVDSIWPAHTKEMALIWFHPSLTKGHSSYNMLYSYLNNKQRYGIVDSDRMEMFMVPLAAYQPIPSKLHPLGGPGLDPCHSSLLLGLILPQRPPSGPNPLPGTKRKSLAFKDSVEVQYFLLPSQVDDHQMQPPPPQSLSDPLWGYECLAGVLPRQEPVLSKEPVSKMVQEALSSLHQETAGGGTSQSLSDVILQLQCDSPLIKEQLGNLTLETSGEQSQQAGICTSPGPLDLGNLLGLLLPSETVCQNHHGVDATHGANLLDTSHVLNMLCPETLLPAEASQIPTPGDTNSLVKETLSLIHYVTQLQTHIAPNQEPPQSLLLQPFSGMPPETASALSSVVAGLELPAVQQSDDEVHAQLQLLLSSLGGQTQSPSTWQSVL